MSDPNAPIYFGHKSNSARGVYYAHLSPNRWWVEIHGLSDPIVELRVRERVASDPAIEKNVPDYWGWHDAEKPDSYVMVWPSKIQLNMCFPYGPEAEEERGRGRRVNLIVKEIS